MRELSTKVAELTMQFNAAVAEKEAVIAEADMCERKLGLAQRLMAALGSEGARWKESIVSRTHTTARTTRTLETVASARDEPASAHACPRLTALKASPRYSVVAIISRA